MPNLIEPPVEPLVVGLLSRWSNGVGPRSVRWPTMLIGLAALTACQTAPLAEDPPVPTEAQRAAARAATVCSGPAELPETQWAKGIKDDQGIGGTGRQELAKGNKDSDGIGGTGFIGTVTGFGSVCIHGLRVQYDAQTPAYADGQSVSVAGLALGQSVSVRAVPDGAAYRATEIRWSHAVVGPVEAIAADRQRFRVWGVWVESSAAIPASLGIGAVVQVSGDRTPSGILATRVEPAAPGAPWVITFPVGAVQGRVVQVADRWWRLSGAEPVPGIGDAVRLRLPEATAAVLKGSASGTTPESAPLVQDWATWLPGAFALPVQRLHVQGLVRASSADTLEVAGVRVRLPQSAPPGALPAGASVAAVVRVEAGGRWVAERWESGRSLSDRALWDGGLRDRGFAGEGGRGSVGDVRGGDRGAARGQDRSGERPGERTGERGSAPGSPASTTPGAGIPGAAVPGGSFPGGSFPGGGFPGGGVPGGGVPGGGMPGGRGGRGG